MLNAKLSTKGEYKMNRTYRVLFAVIGISLFVFTCGCDFIGQQSPSQVEVAVLMAINEGKYSEVKEYLSSEIKSTIEEDMAGRRRYWDKMTCNGTIQRVEILKEEVRGEGARVYVRIHYKDGETIDDDDFLIKENGQWKLTAG